MNLDADELKETGPRILKIARMVFCPQAKEYRSVLMDCQNCEFVELIDEAAVVCQFDEEDKGKK